MNKSSSLFGFILRNKILDYIEYQQFSTIIFNLIY
jgi:hypothetical protein